MDTEKNPFEAVQSMMLDNLEKVGNATKSYLDMVQKAMLGMPAANETQIGTLRAYLDRQVAANQTFVSKLLGSMLSGGQTVIPMLAVMETVPAFS